MIYECDKCTAALPPGVHACPKCGDAFEDAVPADAEVPSSGFKARPATALTTYEQPALRVEPAPVHSQAIAAQPALAEVVYLQNADVLITSTRVQIKSKTYMLANLSSVSMGMIPAARGAGVVWTIFGLLWLWFAYLFSSLVGGVIGTGIVAIGIGLIVQAKVKYLVRIRSASSESNALWAYDQAYIGTIVDTVKEAIIKRG